MARAWHIGTLRLSTKDGAVLIPGWTNGLFGIDWRAGHPISEHACAYVITHLPSGWSICAITANLPDVIRAADEIADALDCAGLSHEQVVTSIRAQQGNLRDLIYRHGGHSPNLYRMPAGVEDSPAAPVTDEWRWWSGPNNEWYSNGPFDTREEAIAELCGQPGYVVEATPALPVSFSASTLIEAQYLEDNDNFDFDHCEPDRRGQPDTIAAADAELQALLDAWCERHADTFVRGNLFGEQRNEERIEAGQVVA